MESSAVAINKANVRKYSYIDGCNNDYNVRPASLQFVYRPILPHESSSGHYSGGEPVNRTFNRDEFNEWERTFERIWKAQGAPKEARWKGDGILIVDYNDNSRCEMTLARDRTLEFDAYGHKLRGLDE